jgi:hypothetical protein
VRRFWEPECTLPQPPDQAAQPLGGGGTLVQYRCRRLGVRQLLRDLREVDFQVMEENVMHR